MSSNVLVFVIIAAAVYLLFVLAHDRFDREPVANESAVAADHLSDLLAPLLSEGLASEPDLRRALAELGGAAEELLAFFGAEDEPWRQRLAEFLADPPRPPYGSIALAVSEPQGRQAGSRPRVLLRRELPGRALVEVLSVDRDEPLVSFELLVNQWQGFPEEVSFEAGAGYRLRVKDSAETGVWSESSFEMIEAAEALEFQRAMTLLKQHVADVRLRIFLQGCIAMSRGLHCEATEIFLKRMPRPEQGAVDRGLLERLVFLFDRRGESVARDRAIAALSS